MKKIFAILLMICICGVALAGCGGSHENEIQSPISANDVKGTNYQELMTKFQDVGFKNIQTEVLDDLVTGWVTKDGDAEQVSINGTTGFSTDTWFPKDASVVITYHTYPKKDEEVTESAIEQNESDNSDEVYTIDNCIELADILQLNDPNDTSIKTFADNYNGKVIEFDGNISSINNHGDYDTRYDILMYAGDYNSKKAIGPNFQFVDVGVNDLGISDLSLPSFVGAGNNIHIKAKIIEYNENSGLFVLDPILITSR